MNTKDLNQNMKKLEELIGYGYERYKSYLSQEEQKMCSMYLYEQGEYEEALTNLIAILHGHKIELDGETQDKFEEARSLMKLDKTS